MEVSIISVIYDRKSKERIKEELLGEKNIEHGFDKQFIKVLTEGIIENGILKVNSRQLNNVA